MALVKISELPVLSTATPATLLATVEGGVTKKLAVADLYTFIVNNAATGFQAKDGDLTSIANLTGTTGILKKTAANTWQLDTSEYLTAVPDEITTKIADLQASQAPAGFSDTVSSVITFNNGTRTLTIAATGSNYTLYLNAVKYVKTTNSVQIANSTGLHYVYFDATDQVLKTSTTLSDEIFKTHAIVSIIYWNTTQAKAIFVSDERHTIGMDGQTRLYLHVTQGTQYRSGLALNNITLGDGSANSHATLSVADGAIANQDIAHTIANNTPQQLSTIARLPIFYRLGSAEWYTTTGTDYPLIMPTSTSQTSGFTRAAYNLNTGGVWSLAEVPNGKFVLVHVYASNDITNPVFGIVGNTYSSAYDANAGSSTDLGDITGLPVAEFARIGTVIFQTSSSYTNTAKSRIVSFNGTTKYIDYRLPSSYIVSSSLDPFKNDGERNPQLTYNGSDQLTRIDYASGNYKTLSYTGTNLSQVDYVRNIGTFRKTLTYASGKLASISYSIL